MRRCLLVLASMAFTGCAAPTAPGPSSPSDAPISLSIAIVATDAGAFTMLLYEDAAPKTVANFRSLAAGGFYDGVTFHRVIDGFVIQTGDPTATGEGGSLARVPGEPGLHFSAGSVGMARDQDPDSATSQWFVCEYPQPHLHDPPEGATYGAFTSWAQVIDGMDVVRAIAEAQTFAGAAPASVPPGVLPDRPIAPVRILSVEIVDVEFPRDVAERFPLRTSGRYVLDDTRTVLETWNEVRASEETMLAWYVVPRREGVEPPRDAAVVARAPSGAVSTIPATRHPIDPFIVWTNATLGERGTWNLTLASPRGMFAELDLDVR
ncbi:MAG TPA: peptidylprolyl isomerase [Candidatus Thermoplasmatota archaeon]|nr:peptidylprolyl isomerase [Candidatus Thermoplasmatota archaeon]